MLSRNLEKSLHRALAYANERRHEYATLEHLLLALTEDQDAIAVLRACSVDLDRLRRDVADLCRQRADQPRVQPQRGRQADRELSARAAARGDPRAVVGTRGGDRRQRAGRDVRRAREPRRLFPARAGHDPLRRGQLHLARHRQGAGRSETRRVQGAEEEERGEKAQKRSHDALDAYCVNLNKKAKRRQDRPADRARGARSSARSRSCAGARKNNPLYVGDPGVGKTAIAEGLARRIVAARGARGAAQRDDLSRSTWARCWPARAIAAISRSG